MKLHSKLNTLFAGLLLGSAMAASAVSVTFKVNMGYQQSLGAFNPATDTMEARGSFQGWSGGFTLTNVPSTSVYQGTYDVAGNAGDTFYFKFVILKNGTDATWESISDRPFTLTGSPQVLPEMYFNDVQAAPTVNVTFSVDMTVQIANGAFTPGGVVEARGSFQTPNPWSGGFTLTNDPAAQNPNIYSGTYSVSNTAAGGTVSYKFVKNNGEWEGRSDRSFKMPTTATNLPVVFFNDELPVKISVTFQVDMSVQILTGAFDPSLDTVQARGSFQSPTAWTGGFTLTNDPAAANTNIFIGVYETGHAAGTVEYYKFVIVKYGDSPNSWAHGESRSDRTYTLAAGGQVLPVVYFDDNSAINNYLPVDTAVTFSVSMTNAVLYPSGTPFDPSIMNGVYINGDFLGWWNWKGTPPPGTDLTNAPGVDKIYSQTVIVPKGTNRKLTYKFGVDYYPTVDTIDNEAGFGMNHIRYIRSTTGSYTMPLDVFGTPVTEPEIGPLLIGPVARGRVMLSWSGWPGIRLQTSPSVSPSAWTDVAGTDGLSATNYPVGSSPTFFRVIKP